MLQREGVRSRLKALHFIHRDENRTAETIITWNNKASDKDKDGYELGTYRSASVTIESDFFCATGITIEVKPNNLFPKLTVFIDHLAQF